MSPDTERNLLDVTLFQFPTIVLPEVMRLFSPCGTKERMRDKSFQRFFPLSFMTWSDLWDHTGLVSFSAESQ